MPFYNRVKKAFLPALWRLCVFMSYAAAFSSLLTLARALFFIHYSSYSDYLIEADFYPINGKFQAYNPIRRLIDGQSPGVDFVSYTGLGPSLVTLGAMVVSECSSFACSVFWGNFLSILSTTAFFSWVLCLCFYSASVPLAPWFLIVVSSVLSMMLTAPLPTNIPQIEDVRAYLSSLHTMGNSQLSLRTACATICSLCIYLVARCKSFTTRALIAGASSSILLLWSNDYGLFSFIAMILAFALCESRQGGISWRGVKRCVIVLAAGILGALVLVTLITRGHPALWFSRNTLGVMEDQMWYFLPHTKVLALEDILLALPHLKKVVVSLLLFTLLATWRPNIPVLYASAGLLFVTLCAGVASQVGGHISKHYMIAFERTFWPVTGIWVVCLIHILLKKVVPAKVFGVLLLCGICIGVGTLAAGASGYRLWVFEQLVYGTFSQLLLPTLWPFVSVFVILTSYYIIKKRSSVTIANLLLLCTLTGYIVLARRADGTNVFTPPLLKRDIRNIESRCAEGGRTYAPALGGCLTKERAQGLDRLHSIAQDSTDIFSTYSSAFDVIQKAFNSSGSDYIIHALGTPWRKQYNDTLIAKENTYVTTIREDFTYWESWVRRTNWAAYSAIVTGYEAVAETEYNVLWRRRDSSESLLPPGRCEVIRESATSTALRVYLPEGVREPAYVGLHIEYSISKLPWWHAPYVLQSYVTIQDGWSSFDGKFGIPSRPGNHEWVFPVEFSQDDFKQSDSPNRVVLIKPVSPGTTLEVLRCTSGFSVPKSRFMPFSKRP
jgi:hypothetical protein